jgi:polar amino acid transport system substrate-binding protein
MKKFLLTVVAIALCLAVVFSLAACNKKADWEYIEKQGKMVIGYTIFNPMNYYNEEGEFIGFDTELAKAVCKELGVEPVFQRINWDNKFNELNSYNIDCIWNGFTYSEERALETEFTKYYLENKQIAVIRTADAGIYTSKESMADAKFTAEEGSAGEDVVEAEFAGKLYTGVDAQTTAIMEVLSGTSDIAIVDSVMAEGTLGGYPTLQIVEGVIFTEEFYAIGFRKGSTETVAKVNAALKKLWDNGTIGDLAEKYNITASLTAIE